MTLGKRLFIIFAVLGCLWADMARGAVTNPDSRADLIADGEADDFTFTFPTTSTSHIEVFLGGVKQVSGYSVALNANQATSPGGTVTFTSPPADDVAVRIQRTLPLTQESVWAPSSPFKAKTFESVFDRLVTQTQQTDRRAADAEATHAADKATQAARDGGQDSTHAADKAAQAVNDAAQNATWAANIAALNGTSHAQSDLSSVLALGTSTPRTLTARFADVVSIKDFGGVDDWNGTTGTNNSIALRQIMNLYPAGGVTVRFPKVGTGKYRFDWVDYIAYGELSGFTFDADPGVEFVLPNNLLWGSSGAKFLRDIPAKFLDMNTDYVMASAFTPGLTKFHREKTQFLSGGDLDTSKARALDLTSSTVGVESYDMTWPFGTPTTRASLVASSYQAQFQPTVGSGVAQLLAFPAIPGTEITCFLEPQYAWDGYLALGVFTIDGQDLYTEANATGWQGGTRVSAHGGVNTAPAVHFAGETLHQSEWLGHSAMTVRVISASEYAVLVNGVERQHIRGLSPITHMVFGALAGTAPAALNFSHFVETSGKKTAGGRALRVGIIGDSITDTQIHSNWPSYMAEALESFAGMRVREIRSVALSGDASAAQLAKLQAMSYADLDLFVILIGVNDVQAQVPLATYTDNVQTMINLLTAAGVPVVIGVPTQFYGRTQAENATTFIGQGQNAINSNDGGRYRAALMYTAAAAEATTPGMVKLSHGTIEELGPVVADWLEPGSTLDPMMSDNIHPTAHGRRVMGYALARSAAALLQGVVDRRYPLRDFETSWWRNSWTSPVGNGGYTVSESGMVSLVGTMYANTGPLIGGTQILQLPGFLAPRRWIRTQAPANLQAGGYVGSVYVVISPTGAVYLQSNMPGAATNIDLEALVYQLPRW